MVVDDEYDLTLFYRISLEYYLWNIQNIEVGFNPDIAASGDNVYIVGEVQGDNTLAIFFRMSTDGGNDFGKVEYVTTMGGSFPSVGAAGIDYLTIFD